MKMHMLSGGRLRMRRSVFVPDAPREELIDLPVLSILLRHVQGNVLFDTGCHPSVISDAPARWGDLAKLMRPIFSAEDTVPAGLAGLGLSAADIDVVVCSHLHPDHCGCNELFPQATLVCHRRELEAAHAPDSGRRGYIAADWDHKLRTEAIDGQHDLFGDGRLVLLPFPGHTPGSIGALVALDRSGAFLLASDTVSLRSSLDRNVLPRNIQDADALHASFEEIRRIEAAGAAVICGHDHAQWQNLRKGADFYD